MGIESIYLMPYMGSIYGTKPRQPVKFQSRELAEVNVGMRVIGGLR